METVLALLFAFGCLLLALALLFHGEPLPPDWGNWPGEDYYGRDTPPPQDDEGEKS